MSSSRNQILHSPTYVIETGLVILFQTVATFELIINVQEQQLVYRLTLSQKLIYHELALSLCHTITYVNFFGLFLISSFFID